MGVKKVTVCIIKLDKDNYKKERIICENYYNINRIKYKDNTFSRNDNFFKKRKVVGSVKNRYLIIGFSNCGKAYLMNHILRQKLEPIFIITKSLNQYSNIKAQTSDEIQTIEKYENSIVVFDNMLPSKQESKIDLFFTRGRHQNIDIYYISESYFHLPKFTIRFNSNIIFLFKQTLRFIILLFHDIAGLDMNLENGNSFVVRLGKMNMIIYKEKELLR